MTIIFGVSSATFVYFSRPTSVHAAAAFVQEIGTTQSKTAGTSIQTSGSKTVTVGNDIFVGFWSDTGTTAWTASDSLGNTYTIEENNVVGSNIRVILFRGSITIGGTLTFVKVSWTTNATAKAMSAHEFSGVGTRSTTGAGSTTTGGSCTYITSKTVPANGLAIGGCGWEMDNTNGTGMTAGNTSGTPTLTNSLAPESSAPGTTGGGDTSNVTGGVFYAVGDSSDSTGYTGVGTWGGAPARTNQGSGAVYNPAAAAGPTTDSNSHIYINASDVYFNAPKVYWN